MNRFDQPNIPDRQDELPFTRCEYCGSDIYKGEGWRIDDRYWCGTWCACKDLGVEEVE